MQVVGRTVQYVLVTVRIGLSPVDDLAYLPVLEWAHGEVTVLPSLPFFPGRSSLAIRWESLAYSSSFSALLTT